MALRKSSSFSSLSSASATRVLLFFEPGFRPGFPLANGRPRVAGIGHIWTVGSTHRILQLALPIFTSRIGGPLKRRSPRCSPITNQTLGGATTKNKSGPEAVAGWRNQRIRFEVSGTATARAVLKEQGGLGAGVEIKLWQHGVPTIYGKMIWKSKGDFTDLCQNALTSFFADAGFAARALALSTSARTIQSPSRVTDLAANFLTRKRPTASGEFELTLASSRSFMGVSSGRVSANAQFVQAEIRRKITQWLTDRFDDAFHYAYRLHRTQTRKGTPILKMI